MAADFTGTPEADAFDGTPDADTINGGAGDDSLRGLDGNDVMDGGAGSDTVEGGEGADDLSWTGSDTGTDRDFYIGGDGHAPVYSDDGYVIGMTGSENYTFDPYNHNGGDSLGLNLGNESDMTLTYSSTEAGTATDADGNTVEFKGIERVYLGDGDMVVDASNADILYQDGPTHTVGMRLYSGNGDDAITGSSGTDYIQSGGGNDTVHAGDGNDVIETGSGDDVAYGEGGDDGYRWGNGGSDASIGNDLYDGGAGFNTVNAWQSAPGEPGENVAGVQVVLDSSASGDIDALGGVDGHLRFLNMQNLRTGSGDDIIDGSASGVDGYRIFADAGDDRIIGSDGNDTLEGGLGADTITGGKGDDFISMNGSIFSATSLPDAHRDTLVLGDDFGQDTIRAFSFGDGLDDEGNPAPADHLDVSELHDAEGNAVRVSDTTVRGDVDQYGNEFAVITFPNGEELWLQDVDPASLTPERLNAMGIPCFAAGTMILTPKGQVAVEDLRPGDLVMTGRHGPRPVRWTGGRTLDRIDLALSPRLNPIRIRAGALGLGLPVADLTVSPQHRVLIRSAIAQRMFGTDEVLVAARQLTALDGIDEVRVDSVTYVHILFDRHETVFSNGAETESLYTGAEAMKSLGRAAQDEIFALFPELRAAPSEPARPFVPGAKARQLAQRHHRNGKALLG
ncbi:Hint domain-containing protein [Paracoccus nototheniae]|uniref:Hint domain-containing protein n=1 Tax=Paracoccus nototheniae TaxID=2489002 RepID=A0ABW4E1U7_9RHOB|nr:Hint domain-containing protein [Paracoccus nototheniae]